MPIPTHEITTPLEFLGVAGSPYTRKMRALLRYRGIPYRMIRGGGAAAAKLPQPKVRLLPTFYLPDESGNKVAVTDSTPLIRRFEAEYSGRSVLPSDPVLRFLDYLIEDYGDEWLTKCMFHFRWAHQENIEKAGSILPFYTKVDLTDEQVAPFSEQITKVQVGRLYVVGSNDTTGPIIEASYHRLLERFDAHLQTLPFLMGGRPGASDFALYGQLTQLALFDTTAVRITVAEAPRVYGWTEDTEDLSGLDPSEEDWLTRDAVPDTLREVLAEVGRVYVPFLLGNAKAVARGAEQVECTVDGEKWVQPAFPYQAKCLKWIREQRSALAQEDRADLDRLLAGTGCEALFQAD
ncbi:MAG: glutathione S-transferase family protein [bacterium]|nr:glutathione S-transferase family protein [bacterium]MCP5043186.1 glutathione S-transferase family protein [bacterium]